MKNKWIAMISLTAVLASGSAVYADVSSGNVTTPQNTDIKTEIQGDIMQTSGSAGVVVPEAVASYIKNAVTAVKLTDGLLETKLSDAVSEGMESTINYIVSDRTLVYDTDGNQKTTGDLKEGMHLVVYTNAYAPAPLIMPPQYQADVIIISGENAMAKFHDVDTYFEDQNMLVNAANQLALHIGKDVNIVGRDDKAVAADALNGKDLLVFYTSSTRSIPAQTTPDKVVVLGENELALASRNAAAGLSGLQEEAAPDYSAFRKLSAAGKEIAGVYVENGILMVPLRETAEALGMTVEWNGTMRSVLLNDGIYTVKIAENSYIKGKMMPLQLSCAPVIKGGRTYVPVEYFAEVCEMTAVSDANDATRLQLYAETK